MNVAAAVLNYVDGGNPGATDTTNTRRGIRPEYTVSCDTGVSFLSIDEMVKLRNKSRVDCMMDILDWSFDTKGLNGDASTFQQGNYLQYSGGRGVNKKCYSSDRSTRSPSPSLISGLRGDGFPLAYIMTWLSMGMDDMDDSPIELAIRANTFFVPRTNDASLGVLLGEFIPPEPPQVPASIGQKAKVFSQFV